jgi:hypothetical protein
MLSKMHMRQAIKYKWNSHETPTEIDLRVQSPNIIYDPMKLSYTRHKTIYFSTSSLVVLFLPKISPLPLYVSILQVGDVKKLVILGKKISSRDMMNSKDRKS